jgi:GT2 family glycosyltransferase
LSTALVSVLVLNYNGKKFLKDCFDSLKSANYSPIEILLIDNKSTDDSILFTKENYPDVQIVQTHANQGYSRAYNIAFKYARGKYAVLLNNDVKVHPDWLGPMVAVAEKEPEIAALQPKILSMMEPGYFEYAGASGGYIDRFGYPFLRGRMFFTIEKDEGQYEDEQEVFWTSGAAMFLRREAIEKSLNLDEDFVHHMEEIDLCWRLHLTGFRLKVVPQSVIWHYAGATIKSDSYKKLYWNHRNNIFMMVKNLEMKNLLLFLPVRLALDFINIFSAVLLRQNLRQSFAIISAYFWLMTNLGLILRKRRVVTQIRTVPDRQISGLIYPGSIVFRYFILRKKTFSSLNFRINTKN